MRAAVFVSLSVPEADPEQLELAGTQLARELDALEVDDVRALPAGPAPLGSRSGTITAIAELLVSLEPTVAVLTSLVATAREWLRRDVSARSIRLEIAGDVLEVTGTSAATQDKLVEEWIRSHGSAPA